MKRPYFTRKNFIVLALAIFYGVVIFFTGICIEAGHSLISKRNVINQLALMLNFTEIDASLAGFVGLVLLAVYIAMFVASVIYVRRYCIENGKKPYRFTAILSYIFSFVVCTALSVGLTLLFIVPRTIENIGTTLLFLGQALMLGTLVYVALLAVVGGAAMLIINFVLIDKPFKFFGKDEMEVVEEDPLPVDMDVATSFDSQSDANGAGGGIGGGGGGGGSGEVTSVKDADGLDDRNKVFPALCSIDAKYGGFELGRIATEKITLEELCIRFRNYLANVEKLYFDIDTIRIFISGFAASHLL